MFISMPVSTWGDRQIDRQIERERDRERDRDRDRDRDREIDRGRERQKDRQRQRVRDGEINTLTIYNKCVITILYTLRYPYEKAMAFGGVATGNMKA